MIIMLIILSAILAFLQTKRRVTEQRHIPQPKSHIPTYSPEQLRQARNDRRITTW